MKKIMENNKLLKADKVIFYISVISSSFLMMIYINHTYTKLSSVLLGAIREMFTIPCVLIQPVLLYLALKFFFKIKFKIKVYVFSTVVISLTTMVFTWGSWLLTMF